MTQIIVEGVHNKRHASGLEVWFDTMPTKAVVEANDEELIAVHKEFKKWNALNSEVAKTDFGFALRHYTR